MYKLPQINYSEYRIDELVSWFMISINEISNYDVKKHDLYDYNVVLKKSEKISKISRIRNGYNIKIKENIINCELVIFEGFFSRKIIIHCITIKEDYRSKGLFTKILNKLENVFCCIDIKDIVNEKLEKFLKKRNYNQIDGNTHKVNLHKACSMIKYLMMYLKYSFNF
jgi:N-acetylglutamate synthase-like GNAT family acetyltransferase